MAFSKAASAAGHAMIDTDSFYSEWHGHRVKHLSTLIESPAFSAPAVRRVWLAGDSSLDNKFWLFGSEHNFLEQLVHPQCTFSSEAVNGYESVLHPAVMAHDVAYWCNAIAAEHLGPGKAVTINTSVEATTIADREDGLLPQDRFIHRNVRAGDFVVASLGGNDIALAPSTCTAISVAALNWSPDWAIRSGWAAGGGHLETLLHGGVQRWLQRMLDVPDARKPERILVCMIYYPDETPSGSWADKLLSLLGYDKNPAKVQLILRTMFDRINAKGFDVHGIPVTCVPLFRVLDSTDTRDYERRVEPSAMGGRKMAAHFMRELFGVGAQPAKDAAPASTPVAAAAAAAAAGGGEEQASAALGGVAATPDAAQQSTHTTSAEHEEEHKPSAATCSGGSHRGAYKA